MLTREGLLSRKGLGGELVAEFIGTMILILFGDGVVAAVILFHGFAPSASASFMLINFGWGFAVMLGIYVAGTLTGAHINPAVTLAFALRRGFPWAKVVPYWIAQLAGAFFAALILFFEYQVGFTSYDAVHHITRGSLESLSTGLVFFTFPRSTVGGTVVPNGWAFFDQVLGTFLLVFLIMAIVDVRNAPPQSNLAALIIGFLIVAIGMSFGVDAGYAINPARDFGPRLFAFFAGWGQVALPGNGPGFTNYFWIPIIGPLLGAAIAAFAYDFSIHTVLEARGIGAIPGVVEEGETVVETRPSADVTTQQERRGSSGEPRA